MKARDIEIGKNYQCNKGFGTAVTCRIVSKHFFGLLMREEHGERWDVGYESYRVYGWVWFWQVVESW